MAKISLLLRAIRDADPAAAASLLALSAPSDFTAADLTAALHAAVRANSIDIVSRLLRAGAKDGAAGDGTGDTALHLASARGLLPIVKALLSQRSHCGAARNARGFTPAFSATAHHHAKTLAALLDAGVAARGVRGGLGLTLYDVADALGDADLGRPELFTPLKKVLRDHGCAPSSPPRWVTAKREDRD